MKKTTLNVKGMHCKSCTMLVQDALEDLGVKADVKLGSVNVEYDETSTPLKKIKDAIIAEGYEVE